MAEGDGVGVTFQTLIRKVPCSNTCRDIWNPVEVFSLFVCVSPDKCQDSSSIIPPFNCFQFKKLPTVRYYSYMM
jgi:hypothetical protein